MGAQSEPATEI